MGWDFPWFNKSCIQLSRRSADPIIYRFGVFIDPSTCLAGFWHIITQKHFPQATSRKTQKKVAFSKKLHLTRETGSNAAEIFFCYVFQTINSQLADRLLFLVLWGGGGKLIKKTIAPSYLQHCTWGKHRSISPIPWLPPMRQLNKGLVFRGFDGDICGFCTKLKVLGLMESLRFGQFLWIVMFERFSYFMES